MNKKNILVLASYAKSLTHFRGDLIADLIANDYSVFAASPEIDEKTREELIVLGAVPVEYSLQRSGLNPVKDLQSLFELRSLMKKYSIHFVFPYTIKPVIYGSLAARSLGIPVFSLITGLGYTFSGVSKKARILQKITQLLYRFALRKNKIVIFQNRDDYHLFLEKNILNPSQEYDIVDGSGVNLDRYPFREKTNDGKKIIFVFVARLIREKGVHLFVEAAKKIKPQFPEAEFHILGSSPKGSPSAIGNETLRKYHEEKIIVHHGRQNHIESYLHNSDVFVLPTFYREGVPRSILEALSVGMPIITTDAPGCRETVIKEQNGFLVTPRSLEDLIEAITFFLKSPEKITSMGLESRKLAEKKFDVKLINARLIELIES
ncbi:glycosyltransferase family 4 protein [Ascidiimonas aurantiaca]|uniref:glycosyltransferase family 4 protein n=1 Tax=Ascidiimonas aurantiaca TaxID=1685432 RepID=UPI0030EE4380